MAERDDMIKRVLGDMTSDPFDLAPEAASRPGSGLAERLTEPVTWGWLLGIVAVLVVLILLT